MVTIYVYIKDKINVVSVCKSFSLLCDLEDNCIKQGA